MTSPTSPWFPWPPSADRPAVRVFCIPFAGGSASAFVRWRAAADPRLDLVPVQPPGRATRLREPRVDRVAPFVRALADAVDAWTDAPYALFGHSMGAAVGFELAREMRRRGRPLPAHMFVSGRRAPQLPPRMPPLHRLDDAALLAELAALNGTPAAVLADAELVALMLPVIRADLTLVETIEYRPEPPLDCPFTAFGGRSDRVGADDLDAWAEQTTGRFAREMFDGDHFFLNAAYPAMLETIAATLLPAPAGDPLAVEAGAGSGDR